MARRPRTIRQGMALAFGRARYAGLANGTDQAALAKRNQAERDNAAKNLQTCWKCLTGFAHNLNKCPACGADIVPF